MKATESAKGVTEIIPVKVKGYVDLSSPQHQTSTKQKDEKELKRLVFEYLETRCKLKDFERWVSIEGYTLESIGLVKDSE